MHVLNAHLPNLEMFLEVGMHAFPKSLINSTKSDIEQDFPLNGLVYSPKIMINF